MDNEKLNTIQQIVEKGKQISGPAKTITLLILILVFIIGVAGSFDILNFNMDKYVHFLETFTWFFVPLIISIGVGTSTKKITDVLKKEDKDK